MTCFAVIAGGGTSGHVLPALAIAEALIDEGISSSEISYFGALRGVETVLVPPSGLSYEFFDVVGLKREKSLAAMRNNLTFLPRLLEARRRAISIMRSDPPQVVVSVGGYASLPAVLAARKCAVPTVVVSYDMRPGRSSQWAARRASRCAVAYPNSPLPRAEWTGAPVRRAIRELVRAEQRDSARRKWKVDEGRFLIGVIGGSLGSGVLNEAVMRFALEHRDDEGLAIRHVVGQRFYSEYEHRTMSSPRGIDYRVVAYEDDMVAMYAAADLLVGRGGAGTVAEVAAAGMPSILVPWSGAADDHQRENVKWLSDSGAAILVEEADVESSLGSVIDGLRQDPSMRDDLARRAWEAGERNRSNRIARAIIEIAGQEASR